MANFLPCALGAALALTGCTMIPPYERPASPVAARYPGITQTNESHATELAWKDFFAEERLHKLIELALANNRDLRVAVLKVEQSRAQYRVTRSASFPGVHGSGSYTRSHASGMTADQWNASLGTTAYELDLFGRVRSLNRQALEKFLATEEARRGAQVSLVTEVASQYLALRQAEEQLRLARQTLTTVRESYGNNKATFDAGASNELDLRTAEGQVLTTQISVLNYERQAAQAENALELLAGQPLPADLPAPRAWGESNWVADIPAGLPSDLLRQRPDILEAEHTLKAANANIGAARAAFFPSLKLTGSIGTTSDETQTLPLAGGGFRGSHPRAHLRLRPPWRWPGKIRNLPGRPWRHRAARHRQRHVERRGQRGRGQPGFRQNLGFVGGFQLSGEKGPARGGN